MSPAEVKQARPAAPRPADPLAVHERWLPWLWFIIAFGSAYLIYAIADLLLVWRLNP